MSVQKWFCRYWNFCPESDPDGKPVNRFAWSRYNNCWSAETINHALVCADQEAPAGLAGAVFAVGTPLAVTRADKKKQCMSHYSGIATYPLLGKVCTVLCGYIFHSHHNHEHFYPLVTLSIKFCDRSRP